MLRIFGIKPKPDKRKGLRWTLLTLLHGSFYKCYCFTFYIDAYLAFPMHIYIECLYIASNHMLIQVLLL